MGLDMWLNKEVYIGAHWDYRKISGHIELKKDGVVLNTPVANIESIVYRVITWRKSNQIHKWFVDNVQGGVDDCDTYTVATDQLKELLDLCNQVLKILDEVKYNIDNDDDYDDDTIAFALDKLSPDNLAILDGLHPQAGFFFGSTEIDEWYYRDVKYTVDALSDLDFEDNVYTTYTYTSSW